MATPGQPSVIATSSRPSRCCHSKESCAWATLGGQQLPRLQMETFQSFII